MPMMIKKLDYYQNGGKALSVKEINWQRVDPLPGRFLVGGWLGNKPKKGICFGTTDNPAPPHVEIREPANMQSIGLAIIKSSDRGITWNQEGNIMRPLLWVRENRV